MQQPVSGERQEGFSWISPGRIKKNQVRSSNIKHVLTILKFLAGLALLVLSVQDIQFGNLVAGIRSANLAWLVLAVLSVVLGLGLKLLRWAILIKIYHIRASPARLFSAYFVGQATNIILPLRGGELVRLGYFAGERIILPEAALTIILEKYQDLVAPTVCGVLVSLKVSLDNSLNLQGWLLPITIIVTLLLLAVILIGPALWEKLRRRNLMPQRLIAWLDTWVQASKWLRNPRQIFPAALLATLIWGVMWFTNLLLFQSLGLSVGGTAAGLVLILVYVSLLPALMPGNIGPFYFFAWLALLPFGVIRDLVFIFAMVLHTIVTLPPLLGGATGLLIHSRHPISA